MAASHDNTVLVIGGGIGGMGCALALNQAGFDVELIEQAPEIGEIGAGIQLGPNAFAAMDALGCGPRARARAVYTDDLIMMDAVDESVVGKISAREEFRNRFKNPYAVIHRADIHLSVYEEVQTKPNVHFHTNSRIESIDIDSKGARVRDANGKEYRGIALIGCDGVKSVVREKLVGDGHRVPGHVVYRAVTPRDEFPADLRWNAATIWVGPNCHLVHYPMRGGEQYNIVVTFHSREKEEWGVREGSREEVQSYFQHIADRPRQLIDKPTSWRRWSIADRDPVAKWGEGRATLLGDAAHPMLQYMAQGACMALEDAVTLREALRVQKGDLEKAFRLYEEKRIPRTARVVYSAREMGRLFHASGVERLVRNQLWQGRSQEHYYDALEWLYGWSVEKCLA
ncbi:MULTISPECIES: 3-hydroxybenzoate 6-monooxygenase [unclassified Beijerinckia]|uniref:3-hydroxybenzoate 6-monooxygenase n=1 Tax=unclassified Beijerinckia TaxID=2638183 RepID=UPI000895DFDD|nr:MULTISPECIES: 3-hydroxybenzoate 6-monooxygenase [unclassified Beijerinckia]MDH7796677.1 2-polyprenyl-6-methoxyphenol hydroxylase-like FAD-dependent oxidoreductase [Beijerinckia sp. GAS462]SEC55310.1 3-hydroxybenzoate 6-hydroxylase [Beijerinckia sp. 28-YEA-48]